MDIDNARLQLIADLLSSSRFGIPPVPILMAATAVIGADEPIWGWAQTWESEEPVTTWTVVVLTAKGLFQARGSHPGSGWDGSWEATSVDDFSSSYWATADALNLEIGGIQETTSRWRSEDGARSLGYDSTRVDFSGGRSFVTPDPTHLPSPADRPRLEEFLPAFRSVWPQGAAAG